jgi:hypothetical protein
MRGRITWTIGTGKDSLFEFAIWWIPRLNLSAYCLSQTV